VLVTSRLGRWPINLTHLPLELLPPQDAVHYLQARVAKEGHHAGDETTAQQLAEELGYLPLALEQAASYILELRWSFDKYRERFHEARPELLSYQAEGGTRYPASVAKTWTITLERLGPLARALLRLAAWFAPDGIARGIFLADPAIFSEALGESIDASNLSIEKALGDLARFSLIHLTPETVSIHRLLQAVELDALTKDECARWLEWSARLFIAFLPLHTDNVLLGLRSHAETLVKHTQLLWPFRAYREGKQALLRRVLHMQLWAVISDIESVERLRRLVRDKYRLDAGVDWHSYWTEMLSQGL
jgi:hypothetical protein